MTRVLIAEDEPVSRKMLCHILESSGYDVVAAEDGLQAWEHLQAAKDIHLAILDWMMPGLDGLEICRKLQERNTSSIIYVILLTAREGSGDVTEALQAGAHDFVTKPYQKEELLARLRTGERIIQLQTQLLQAQKLESIGQLASGVAHEINTPIQYVGDNIRFMQEIHSDIHKVLDKYQQLLEGNRQKIVSEELIEEIEAIMEETDIQFALEEIPKALEQSIQGIDRISKIVRSMRDFAHPGVEEKTNIDINNAIDSTLTVTRNKWKFIAEMETNFASDLPLVGCYPAELNQAILNIIVNAADAIEEVVGDKPEEKGRITITTARKKDKLEIRISDTGPGIPKEMQDKIFNPFFTTKEVGKGTGQGLTITHSIIVNKHGGTINFESEQGKGTTFIITLPIERETADVEMEVSV